MKNGIELTRSDDLNDKINQINLSVNRLSISIEHHDKAIERMSSLLEAQAVTSHQIETVVNLINDLKLDIKGIEQKNEQKFKGFRLQITLIVAAIVAIAYESGIDLGFILSLL